MKKLRALIIVVILLPITAIIALAEAAAPDNGASPKGGDITIYFTASVDGEIQVAAEPVKVTTATVDGALMAANRTLYSGGEAGYVSGIDKTWNMYLITTCWGVAATPNVLVNGIPTGSAGLAGTVDTIAVHDGDNIVMSTSTDSMTNPAKAVGLVVEKKDGITTVTATNWVLDMATFQYSTSPLVDADVVEPATGALLGKTDAEGKIALTPPDSGIVAVAGVAAIRVDDSGKTAADIAAAAAAEKEANKPPVFYGATYQLIAITSVLMIPVFTIIIINMIKQSKKDKMLFKK